MNHIILLVAITVCSLYCSEAAPSQSRCEPEKTIGDLYKEVTAKTTKAVNPRDCQEIYENGQHESGLYTIQVGPANRPVSYQVYCDMTLPGGGWTVILKRRETSDNPINFTRDWNDYVRGFGDYDNGFMMGLEQLHQMTRKEDSDEPNMELFVGLQSHHKEFFRTQCDDIYRHARYSRFSVGSSRTNYKLFIGGFDKDDSPAGDSLLKHNGTPFSTYDEDHDDAEDINCSRKYRGGWWYTDCLHSQLTGEPKVGHHESHDDGIIWSSWLKDNYSLKSAVMAIRRVRN